MRTVSPTCPLCVSEFPWKPNPHKVRYLKLYTKVPNKLEIERPLCVKYCSHWALPICSQSLPSHTSLFLFASLSSFSWPVSGIQVTAHFLANPGAIHPHLRIFANIQSFRWNFSQGSSLSNPLWKILVTFLYVYSIFRTFCLLLKCFDWLIQIFNTRRNPFSFEGFCLLIGTSSAFPSLWRP